jgi:hypothetical protein
MANAKLGVFHPEQEVPQAVYVNVLPLSFLQAAKASGHRKVYLRGKEGWVNRIQRSDMEGYVVVTLLCMEGVYRVHVPYELS